MRLSPLTCGEKLALLVIYGKVEKRQRKNRGERRKTAIKGRTSPFLIHYGLKKEL